MLSLDDRQNMNEELNQTGNESPRGPFYPPIP